MKFTPFNFQAPLAAGGVTLMAFNWLNFAVPHGEGPVAFVDIQWTGLSVSQASVYGPLVAIMLVLAIANLALMGVFTRDLARWLTGGEGYREFMSGPPSRVTGIMVPIAATAMTIAILFAVVPFFFAPTAERIQEFVVPGVAAFVGLLAAALVLEFRLLRGWLGTPPDTGGLNFVWLLDAFAFGLVSLAGTGLASAAGTPVTATVAASGSLIALVVGSALLAWKLIVLTYVQLKSRALPELQLQPAFFLVVPIACLYGISYFRATQYLHRWYEIDLALPARILVVSSYAAAVGWALVTVYLLGRYFRSYFRTSQYFPTQWAMV